MAMRLSGMMSGMDTESLVQQLVEAKSTKVNTKKKAQTKLSWKQDAWKELNTKLKNLQQKYLSTMRFSDAYMKKTTKVSNSSVASVITGENAVNGVQTLEVSKLAKTGYLTGAELKGEDGETKGNYTALTKLGELGYEGGNGTFSVKSGGKTVDISVNGDTTISDVLDKLKSAGLNASFDSKSQRFFVSAKESGAASDFSITASDENGMSALSKLGLQAGISGDKADTATWKEYQKYAAYYVAGDRDATVANMQSLIDKEVASRTDSYLNQYKSLQASVDAANKKIAEINEKHQDDPLGTAEGYASQLETKNAEIKEIEDALAGGTLTDAEKQAKEEALAALKEEAADLTARKTDAETLAAQQESVTKLQGQMDDLGRYVTVTATEGEDGVVSYTAEATADLLSEVEDGYYAKAEFAARVVADPSIIASSGATKVSGQDAVITLNGAEFANSSNTFEINGLTITANAETKEGESVTITTQNDTDGIYDVVKNFLKEYNSIINEMDKLYNADSAKGYEPLTSDEKSAMSDSEVEEYEKKIKDALLRRDDNLSSISSALKSVMSGGVEVNGKMMYLSDFGIDTLGYFSAADNEKNAYHIAGDPDDSDTSGNADVLKGLIASDPDTVTSFFTKLSQNLYGKMSDLSKSVDGYRSFGSFYDDKKMKSDYEDYTTKIASLEEKLNDYEDKWYKKFSKMETAMAKMQSNANAITGLLGG